ncbi:MAG: patatin-like phospholipase family protein [Longimicrobiaceae bacterium]
MASNGFPESGSADANAADAVERDPFALVFTGGGARAAYQVGVVRWLARAFPDRFPPILTGVSAGAVNAAHLANHHGSFLQAAEELVGLWESLTPERVFRVDVSSLGWKAARWGLQLVSGGHLRAGEARGLVDTTPLHRFLEEALHAVGGELTGIEYNLARRRLRAVGLITTSYSTSQAVIWLQGRDGIEPWTRPQRRSRTDRLTVSHVMASAALPLVFPAVRIEDGWYGDGGVRLTAPLSPALHLGATRMIAVSTRHDRSQTEADLPKVVGYPPPIHVAGLMLNAVFLDVIDQDALQMEKINQLVRQLPAEKRNGMRIVDLLVIRPSEDLGRLAAAYEPRLPKPLRFLTRGLGSKQTSTPDLISLLMFQPDYVRRLIEMGEHDAELRRAEITGFLARESISEMIT